MQTTTSKIWIQAARPRTLPLALSSIVLGTLLAASRQQMDLPVALLALLTATFLQVLSNLANDYGDSIHGADRPDRSGPKRAVQSGAVSMNAMRNAIGVLALLSVLAGIGTLLAAFLPDNMHLFWLFIGLGALAILAAITYTAGWLPYGYAGFGDVSVLIFFGWVGVMGSYFLQAQRLDWDILLPATSCGLMAVAVLNVNNMRDIASDKVAGKHTIPVRLGVQRAAAYHLLVLALAILCAFAFVLMNNPAAGNFLFVLSLPLVIKTGLEVYRARSGHLDPFLKKSVAATLLFVLTFGIGQLF
jgi:1,4-dihydroxy-2-naphthoate octaprenyltransferase